MRDLFTGSEFQTPSSDKIPENISNTIIDKIYTFSKQKPAGLVHKENLKTRAKVMLTLCNDKSCKLCNGQIVTVEHFKQDEDGM